MFIYKLVIIFSFLANYLNGINAYELNREIFKFSKNETSNTNFSKSNLEVLYKRTLQVDELKEILILDNVNLDFILSSVGLGSLKENKSEGNNLIASDGSVHELVAQGWNSVNIKK